MKMIGTAFLLVLLSVVTSAARTTQNSNPCSMKCSSQQDSLFRIGQTYTYSYQGESEIKTLNGLYEMTGVSIKSKVKITTISNCEMKLSMSDIEVFDKTSKDGNKFKEIPNNVKFKQILQQNDVFFTRVNGKVQSVCMDKDEPIWSQNIKKVIIDSLVNQGRQTDTKEMQRTSHGNCMMRSEPTNTKTNSVNVYYNLQDCDNKKMPQSFFTDITQATVFEKSEVNCQYEYQNEFDVKSVNCQEEYKMTPFKESSNRIVVNIKTKITKDQQANSVDSTFAGKNLIETGIEQSEDELQEEGSTYSSVKQVLNEICVQQTDSISSKIPKLFMKLVNQLKDLNSKEFKEIYLDITKNDICPGQKSEIRSIFYDAIGFVSTPAAISVMVELIKSNKMTEFDQNIWLTSLAFIQQTPTIEMLKELESLISTDTPSTPMYLGISAVTSLYCKHNYQSCLSDATIKSIVSKFLKNLNSDCSTGDNKEHLSKIFISLKAIGNLKLFTDDVTNVITSCISKTTNPVSVRVSALEVMKHMGCQKNRKVAMEILENNENDSELRINAYLTVMGCSDVNTLFKVREILSKEKVNQVGSFIWTHLTNIKESRDFLKQDLQELLNDVKLKKEFDISKLKFSRNVEKTLRSDKFGMTFDSNIIFSEKSFVPRSISLNTTASIFGRSTNFVELSARLEGLEELLYKLLGPDGILKKKSDISDNVELINMLNEMDGNMNIKLYGQQISFIELVRGTLGAGKKYDIISEILGWAQDKSVEFNKNIQIIDKTAVLPTMLGFPLQFKLQGSVSINLKVKSKLDIGGLFNWPISFNIENHISPNINAELISDISLQTPFAKYGMGLNLRSGSNTEFKATIYASKNEEFLIKIDTPKSKQSLISFEGNTYVTHRNNEMVQLLDKLKQQELCTPNKITSILGVKLCGTVRSIDPAFRKDTLFSGPFSAEIFIQKEDSQTGYVVRGSSKREKYISEFGQAFENRFIKFEIDTPNSKLQKRRIFGEIIVDFKEKQIKFEIETPWNQALVLTSFKFSNEEKKIGFNIKLDKADIVDISTELLRFSSNRGHTIKGGFALTVLKMSQIKTRWSLESTTDQWLFNLFSKGLIKEDTKIQIKVSKVKAIKELSIFNKYQVSGFYNSYFGNGKISGIASENYYGHRWDVKLNHKPRDRNSNELMFIFRHKTEDKSTKNLRKLFLTTTFSYGPKAENFLKIKTENELSEKHIRTSLKVSYNQGEGDKSTGDEIDLQLYGGFTWKEDNIHYTEGSLSFKIPSKKLNYEGRFNSEVGQKMFKMALALDHDQQSKVSLKINYLQPKLYLKDTDFEVTFSIPNHNVNVKWNLAETDVNRYKYQMDGKYNSYNMRIDGLQTQISKLNHDSYISITMPQIEALPKKIKLNLNINLVDLANGKIQASVEVPNTDYKYAFDTRFSYTPNNLLQMPTSEKKSVFKYEIEISGLDRKVNSKFIFTCNPEEFQTYLNFNFNAEIGPENQFEFDIHALHKNPNSKLFTNVVRVSVAYPGNRNSLEFKSEFKYTEMIAQIDLMWSNNRRITINTMYEIDNSWTQKGLTSSLTIKTPFKGYEQTHLGINAVGQLRYRKIDFECKWGANKKILFDIVVQPRSSNDFSMSFKLVTPFKGWNLISVKANHAVGTNLLNTQVSLEIGPNLHYQLKLDIANNQGETTRDFVASLLIKSGIYPAFKISVVHKDDKVHYKSQFDVMWMETQSINIKSDISYTLVGYKLLTKGEIVFSSTIERVKQMKTSWSMENRDGQFSKNIQIFHNFNSLFQSSIKGFYDKEPGIFKMEFNGDATVLNGRTLKIANNLNYVHANDLQNRFTVNQDSSSVYSHNFVWRPEYLSMKILIPSTTFKTIEIEHIVKSEAQKQESTSFVKIGEKYLVKINNKYTMKLVAQNLDFELKYKLYSDFTARKEIQNDIKISKDQETLKIDYELKSDEKEILKTSVEVTLKNHFQVGKFSLETTCSHIRKMELKIDNIAKTQNGTWSNIFEFTLNDNMKVSSKIMVQGFQLINIDMELKKDSYRRFLKFKHNHHLMGYEHLLDTNCFGKRLKFASSTESRGGFAIQSSFNGDFWFLKSFDITGRFSKQSELKINYRFARDLKNIERIKISYSTLKGIYKFSIETDAYFKTEFVLDFNDFKKMSFEMQTLEMSGKPNIKIQLDYEGGKNALKHSNVLKLNVGNYKFELENKLEKVKWKYLLVESSFVTNFDRPRNYKVGLEYKVKPATFVVDVKAFFNEKFVKLSTNFDSSSGMKAEIRIETSFPVLKEMAFELKHKQNDLLTQVTHRCKAIVQSNESVFEFDHEIEWSGSNYIKVDLSMSGKMSANSYLIQPKLLKFEHQFHKNDLKENIQFHFSKDVNFKVQLDIPVQSKSKSLFQLESSFEKLKKLSVDFNINFSEMEDKSISLDVKKNNDKLFFWESKWKIQNKILSFSTIMETSENYQTGLEIEYSETNFGTKILKGKLSNTLLAETVVLSARIDLVSKELTMSLTGIKNYPITIYGMYTSDKYILKLACGNFHSNFILAFDKTEGIKHIKATISAIVNITVELIRSSMSVKLMGGYNKNTLEMACNYNGEVSVDFNILDTSFGVVVKRTPRSDSDKYVLEGKSNLKAWTVFQSEITWTYNSAKCEFKTNFKQQDKEVFYLKVENTFSRSFKFQYASMLEMIKFGNFDLTYENLPNQMSMKFDGESFGRKSINAEYKLDKNSFTGKVSSPFEWIRDVSIKGDFVMTNTGVKGAFLVKHNKLIQSINGEFELQFQTNLFQMKLKTPFPMPYNELSFKKETTKTSSLIELKDKQNTLFSFKTVTPSNSKYQMDIDLNVPKFINDFTLSLSALCDFENPTNLMKLSVKSNQLEDFTADMNWNLNTRIFKIQFSNPLKESLFEVKVSQYQIFGKQIEISTQYGEIKHAAEFIYEMENVNEIYLKTIYKSSVFSSLFSSIEVNYKHKVDLPKNFNIELQTKFDDKSVFLNTVSWQLESDKSFDLTGKLILSPYTKEYESKIEVSHRRGQILTLVISSAEILKDDISIRILNKLENKELTITSPFELIKSLKFNSRSEQKMNSWTNTMTLVSNLVGKYEMITEYKVLSNVDVQISSQINTPSTNKKIYSQVNLKNQNVEQSINGQVEFDSQVYRVFLGREQQQVEMKINTPFEYLKNVNLIVKQKTNLYEIESIYLQHQVKAAVSMNREMISVSIESNTTYFKVMSVVIARTGTGNADQSITLKLNKDLKSISIKFDLNSEKSSYKYSMENDLTTYLPKSFSAVTRYSSDFMDTFVDVKSNGLSILNLIFNRDEFLFHSRLFTETKIGINRMKFEMILLTEKIFSVLITKTPENEINADLKVNGNQYSLKTIFEYSAVKYVWKLEFYKDTINKVLEINKEINFAQRFIDMETSYLSKSIFKFKLSEKGNTGRSIAFEAKLLSLIGVGDFVFENKHDSTNFKLSWNVLYDDQQLHLGSIVYGLKTSRPLNFQILVNLRSASYQIQLMEMDNGKLRIKISTPFKGVDIDLKWLYEKREDIHEISGSVQNSLIGEYSSKTMWQFNQDPEIQFFLSSTSPIIKYRLSVVTSTDKEVSLSTEFRLFDWDKLEFNFKLSTKSLIEMIVSLKSPFAFAKEIQIKKIINYTSILHQNYEATVVYDGVNVYKYVGGHEIYLGRKIFKIQGSFHKEETKWVSFNIDHFGTHDKLNHSFIWHIKDRKYGFRLDGGFRPMFEGKGEIFTPFHETGKVVLMGKQTETGIRIEAGKDDENLSSFEYTSKKDVMFMKITPPESYGKPITINHRSKRYKRSVGNEMVSEIIYGSEKLIEWSHKVQFDKEKYSALLNVAAPIITKKSAEISLNHNYESKTWKFNHHLKIKDSVHRVYRLFGDLFHENSKIFKVSLNTEHPDLGTSHLSLGHSFTPNNYVHHMLMKHGDNTLMKCNGHIKYDFDKSSFLGELKTKVGSKDFLLQASHDGNSKKFGQNVLMEYEGSPYLRYKSQIVPEEKSDIEIELPNLASSLIKVYVDAMAKQIGLSYKSRFSSFSVEMLNKNGLIELSCKKGEESIGSVKIGYATQPLFIKGTYLKHWGIIEMKLDNSILTLKMESTCAKLKRVTLKISSNKFMSEMEYFGQPYTLNAEYKYSPNNLYVLINSSVKKISKIEFEASPGEIKLTFNDYYQTFQYILNKDQVQIIDKNNFLPIRKLLIDIVLKSPNTVLFNLAVNSYTSESKIEYSNEKIALESKNNLFSVRHFGFEYDSKLETDLKHWTVKLSVNQLQALKAQFQIQNRVYSVGVETYLDKHIVASLNVPLKELIVSLKRKDDYLNIIQKVRGMTTANSKTFILETRLDSSFDLFRKIKSEFSYTVTGYGYHCKLLSEYNSKILEIKGEISKSKLMIHINKNNLIYNMTITRNSADNVVLEIVRPGYKFVMKLEKEKNQFSCDMICNDKTVLKIVINQTPVTKSKFEHESSVVFYGQKVWSLTLKTDLKKYEIRINKPVNFDLAVTNDWQEKEMTTLAFLLKYERQEIGAGIRFLSNSQSRSVEIHIENNFHLITVKQTIDGSLVRQVSVTLTNKNTKDQWELISKTRKESKLEIYWKTPTSQQEIKYNQVIENNVRTLIELEVLGQLKLKLKTNGKTPNLWSGTLDLVSITVARIEVGKDYVEAFINEAGSEKERIYLKWKTSMNGEWKKDYVSTRQLTIVQPALNINMDATQTTTMKKTLYSTLTNVKYQSVDGTVEKLNFGASVDFSESNKVTFELKNPILQIKTVIVRLQPDESTLRYEMESYLNVNDKVSGYVEIKTGSNPGVTTKIYYNPQDLSEFLQLHCKYIDDRQMETIVFTEKQEAKTIYFQLLLRLLNEKTIKSTFHLKTFLLSKLKSSVNHYEMALSRKSAIFIITGWKWVASEVENRIEQAIKIIPNGKAMNVKLNQLAIQISTEMRSISQEIGMMFRRNEFFVKTTSNLVSAVVVTVMRVVRCFEMYMVYMEKIQSQVVKFVTVITKTIVGLHNHLCTYVYNRVYQLMEPIKMQLVKCFEKIFPKLQERIIAIIENIKITFDRSFMNTLTVSMDIRRYVKLFFLSRTYKVIEKTIAILKSTVGQLMSGSFDYLKHEADIKGLYSDLVGKLENLATRILSRIDDLMNRADGSLNLITGDKYFQNLAKVISSVTKYLIDQLKDESYQKLLQNTVVSEISKTISMFESEIAYLTMQRIWPYYIILDNNKHQILDSDQEVKLTLEFKSIIPINDFKSLPDFGYVTRKINKMKSLIVFVKQVLKGRLLSGYKLVEMSDWFRLSMPTTNFQSLLPAFESYATISKTSVVTFDKQSFLLSSHACRILLSKDNKFNKWEILLDQTKSDRFYQVNIGSNSIEISASDYRVKLNGKPTELPLEIDTITLVGFGKVMKLKEESLGLTITVDPTNEILTVGISDWYHGKVRGLFGNSDNEPFNDLMLDNGKIATVKEFTKFYNGNKQSCGIQLEKEKTVKSIGSCPFLKRVACKFLYRCPFSPLQPCFGTVDPSKFYNMCTNSNEELLTKLDPSICDSAKQYQAQCNHAGVKISIPFPCRKCEQKNEKPLLVNEFKTIKIKDKVSDIIFVVDAGGCLNSLQSNLPNLVSTLEKDMHTKGMTSVRFGLVMFVENSVSNARFHTVGQKKFGSSEEMIKSINSLKPSLGKFKDVTDAISLASSYPFREHASRHIIMISCSSFTELPLTLQTMSETLQQKAIQFSLLTDFSFTLNDSKKKTIIFGVDSKMIYTSVSRNGDKSLCSRPTNDVLYQLAMTMKGVVFNYKFMTTNSQRFISSFSNQISNRATPARSAKCTCLDDGEYSCTPLDTHTIFPIKKIMT